MLSRIRLNALLAVLVAVCAGDLAAQQAATITGRVTGDGGAGIASAQVVVTHEVTGVQTGALSGNDGGFVVEGVRPGGPYTVEVIMIGYGGQSATGVSLEAGQSLALDFSLSQEAIAFDALEVFATKAQDRQTPVAFTNLSKTQIQNQLGSRDLPMVLNVTPSVYATQQGGGAGDARVNVRGFNQRNTAVMINGVPVNDMENGWVYWSNWDGLGDAASDIQVQRGLSAVNLATPSIGGTLNVITDPADRAGSLMYKQEFGQGSLDDGGGWGLGNNMMKTTLVANTGPMGPFAATASVVRKTGGGMYQGFTGGDALWMDAWAYYLATSFQLNPSNRLEAYAVGAPQRHGQNLYKLNLASLDADFARSLDGFDAGAFEDYPEIGRGRSPNVAPVSASYAGTQFNSTGPDAGHRDRFNSGYLNERENYFHKPQVNLNWYSFFGDGLSLSTVGYYSGGRGGGTGTYGSLRWNYDYGQRVADWDATIDRNRSNSTGSRGILRNSVNNQNTLGVISKLRKSFEGGLTAEVGVDWRTANIEHYREVRDLLGGAYYNDCFRSCSSDFWTEAEQNRGLGDKINYHNENTVDWLGAYLQAERSTTEGSLYGMFGWAQNSYTFVDFFRRDAAGSGGYRTLESGNIGGYQFKGGAVRNLNDQWSIFGNAGVISKVPIFDGVIDDNNGTLNPDPKNEKFLSFEVGTQFRSTNRQVSLDINLYHTTWRNRTLTRFVQNIGGVEGVDGLVNLLGVDARHMGIEAEGAYQPSNLLRFDWAVSLGNWKYLEDVSGTYRPDDQSSETESYDFYISGLKVADAPQHQMAFSASVYPSDAAYLSLVGMFYGDHFAQFEPFSRTNADDRGIQSWQPPGYSLFHLHTSYSLGDVLPIANGGSLRVFANVYNLFDSVYIQDATDASRWNGYHDDGDRHDADSAEVFLGYPRNLNVGFQIIF
ncbi:MAG: TonB-dependent receptor [Gammaproteobacteria bacterium]|nr:TonB-dependent receptor [Gammaproteobacteria bacterium]MYC52496.1 TonB-dependent receptor [Gammaproteobacteria bacterium]